MIRQFVPLRYVFLCSRRSPVKGKRSTHLCARTVDYDEGAILSLKFCRVSSNKCRRRIVCHLPWCIVCGHISHSQPCACEYTVYIHSLFEMIYERTVSSDCCLKPLSVMLCCVYFSYILYSFMLQRDTISRVFECCLTQAQFVFGLLLCDESYMVLQ